MELPLELKYESDGTRRFYALAGEFFLCIHVPYTSISDELDIQLHPMLSRWLIDFFHNYKKDSAAQLVFTTHNTDIMDPKLFRRDQIWFATKDRATGASTLFSLSDYKRRKGENYRKNYLEGRYGAIPILEKFDGLELKEESR
jgi:AAA15 family ATPase/GTPase